MIEYCLNIVPYMQPKPHKNHGGDCFACALTGILRHLFPDSHPDFDTVWNYFMQPYYNSDKKGLSNSWSGMKKAVQNAEEDGYRVEYEYDIVRPTFDNIKTWSYTFFPHVPSKEFTRRLEGWLRSGWVALQEINYAGAGYRNEKGRYNDSDHFVLVDGVREIWEQSERVEGASSLEFYVHVVCSTKGSYWINTRDFLIRHGAGAWLLVRKDVR